MNNGSSKGNCQTMCWVGAAVGGLVAMFILHGSANWGWFWAIVAGLLVFGIGGVLLTTYVCAAASGGSAADTAAPTRASTPTATASTGAANAAAMAPTAVTTAVPAAAAPKAETPEATPKTALTKAAKPAGKTAAKAAPKAAPKAAATKAAAKATPKAAPAKAAKAAKAATKPVAPDGKPEMLAKPRGGAGDDLKQIKGVGPKMEKMLNKMGVWHFDQVASWRKAEVSWVDENLEGFKGRVSRDDWVKQAKVLATGGTTEFAAKVKKGGVY